MSILTKTLELMDVLPRFYAAMELAPVDEACALLRRSTGIVTLGVGKSGYVARQVASVFSTAGHPAWFLHPTECGHGEGAKLRGEALLVFSESGNTLELKDVLGDGTGVILVTANSKPSLPYELKFLLPELKERIPMLTPTLMLLVGDGLVDALGERSYRHPLGERGSSQSEHRAPGEPSTRKFLQVVPGDKT